MAGMKKVFLIGNLGSDPVLRQVGDSPVASFSLAVNEKGRNGQEESTEWFRVSAWRRQAEIVMQYLTKGSQVFVSGDLRRSEYTDQNGARKTSLDVSMQDMQMLSSRNAPAGEAGAPTTTGWKPPTLHLEDDGDLPF